MADWPMFRGDIAHTAFTDEELAPPLDLLWKFPTSSIVESSPCVVDKTVYFGSFNRSFYALDAETGALKWEFPSKGEILLSPCVFNDIVYFGSWDNNFYALDARDGQLVWDFPTDNKIQSAPCIFDNIVYFGSWDKYFYALDSESGQLIWHQDTGARVTSSPCFSDGIIYVSSGRSLFAFDAYTGSEIWTFMSGDWISSSAAVEDDILYVGSWDSNVYALNTQTGKVIATFPTGNKVTSSPAIANGVVYIGSWDLHCYALKKESLEALWKFKTQDKIHSSPCVAGSMLYIGSNDHCLYTVDVNSQQSWQFETGDYVWSSPCVSDGAVYFGSGDGHLYALGRKKEEDEKKNEVLQVSDPSEFYLQEGENYLAEDNYTLAIEILEKALSLRPDDYRIFFSLGNAYLMRGMDDRAIAYYRRALALNPTLKEAYFYIGAIFEREGNFPDAILEYQMCLQIDPNYPEAHYNLANIYHYKQMYEQAIEEYRKAAVVRNNDSEIYFNLGVLYHEKNMLPEAYEAFKKANEINPLDEEAEFNVKILAEELKAKAPVSPPPPETPKDELDEEVSTVIKPKKEEAVEKEYVSTQIRHRSSKAVNIIKSAVPLTTKAMQEEKITSTMQMPPQEAVEIKQEELTNTIKGYELIKEIARGGMGLIYLARRANRDTSYVLKIPYDHLLSDSDFITRFLREAEIGRALHHPNIIRIYDSGEDRGIPFIAMEYVDGKDLRKVIKERAPLPIREAIEIIYQICEALDYAHLKGIIHRDIKPENIMVTNDGLVKVMDYGIARALFMRRLTMTGIQLGTPYYMSPDVMLKGQIDNRSDLYSVGVLFYELLTRKLVFPGRDPFAIMEAHREKLPVPPIQLNPSIPAELNDLVLKLLEKDPANRYQNAEELLITLREIRNII